ncbi:Plant self-incompatibility protein S1 [Sesbania bispinosa]|nr:Plant self-incompatibility protein S1 [Sesbania bispinosa]
MERKRHYSDVSASFKINNSVLALGFFFAFVLPTLLSASSSFATNKDSGNVFPEFIKWHIYIVNGLSNSQNLITHCKSSENDLGIQNLSPSSNITWSFKTDFFHSTLFWCYVSKDNAFASFEVFWYDAHLFNKCDWKNCIWVAKDDGIYLKDLSEKLDELFYRWNVGI